MTAIELRKKIMEHVNSIDNEEVLKEIFNIIRIESGMEPVYKLTEAERKGVEEGLRDIHEGRVYSSEEADNLIRKWLKK